jgi:tetratricopeptide (TPR) repeat protein
LSKRQFSSEQIAPLAIWFILSGILVSMRGPHWLGTIYGNVGFERLNHELASVDDDSQRRAQSANALEKAVWYARDARPFYRGLGLLYHLEGDSDTAVIAFKAAELPIEDLLLFSQRSLTEEHHARAISWATYAVILYSNSGEAWFALALGQQRAGLASEALFAYEQALASPNWVTVRRSDVLYKIGVIYQRHRPEPNSLQIAREYYNAALAIDDFQVPYYHADTWYGLGLIARESGQPPGDYAPYFLEAVRIYERHATAHIMSGWAIWALNADYEAAAKAMEHGIALEPANASFYAHLAELATEARQFDAARAAWQRVLALNPGDVRATERLGQLGNSD